MVAARRLTPGHRARGHRSRRDARVRVAAGSALVLSLVLVTYWWVTGRGVQDLSGWESGLDSIGRLTGLWSADLLLAQVLLMARLPILEGAFGQDRLAHIHRLVGFTSFNLILCHLVLIVWGYAGGRIAEAPTTLWDMTIHDPGMLLAAAGTACLVMVVVTSVKSARSRLRYESWHLLHLYGYVGAGLALPHQLWTGQEMLVSTAATIYWWSAWAITALAVAVWRVVLPLRRNLQHSMSVKSVVEEEGGVVSVVLGGWRLDRLRVESGQFFVWRFWDGPGRSRGNPYSLSAAPDGRTLRITAREVGEQSARLRHLAPGTRVIFEGPYGRLGERTRTRNRIAFIGAGVGVTPLRSLAESMDYRPGDAVLLQRYRSHPLMVDELLTLQRDRGLDLLWLPGVRRSADSWLGHHVDGADDREALDYWVPDIAERDVFLCGPPEWTNHVVSTLRQLGLGTKYIHIEHFAW